MIKSGKKINILTLVLSENKILNETKNHNPPPPPPPFKLNGRSLIRPKLEYCCTVWDPHTSENINSLEKVQRQAARYTCNRHHNTSSVSEMLNTMNWQALQES